MQKYEVKGIICGFTSTDTSSPVSLGSDPDSTSQTLSESEKLRSHGITFRDPETGVLYVQMQLLQVRFIIHVLPYLQK